MTATASSPAHARLRAIDPARAALQSALVEALNHRRAGELALSAHVAEAGAADAWIALEAAGATLHVAPLLADGAVPTLLDPAGVPDAALAAVALGAVEPLIAAAELTTGRALRPTRLVTTLPGDPIILHLEAQADGVPVHRLLLAVDADAALAPVGRLASDGSGAAGVAPAWIARIAGPDVPLASLARMQPSDLLLLGTPLGLAHFVPPGRDRTLAARLDVKGGLMVVEHDFGRADLAVAPDDDTRGETAISVGTAIELDGGGLTLDRLAALGKGSVVAIPGAAGGVLPARLVAGGRTIASGELVAVGDGYGLLITALARREG